MLEHLHQWVLPGLNGSYLHELDFVIMYYLHGVGSNKELGDPE